jgi:hypothetical protein
MSTKRIFTAGKCNIVTGARVKKRRPAEIIDVERSAVDRIHPVRVDVQDQHTTLELSDEHAFELAMGLLEALPTSYLGDPSRLKRVEELALHTAAELRRARQ